MKLTTKEKLKQLLAEKGLKVDFFIPVAGFWKQQDVHRWEAYAWNENKDNRKYHLFSWNTMTDCIKHGLHIEYQEFHSIEIISKNECSKP